MYSSPSTPTFIWRRKRRACAFRRPGNPRARGYWRTAGFTSAPHSSSSCHFSRVHAHMAGFAGIVNGGRGEPVQKANRMSLKDCFDAMVLGGRYTLSIGCLVPSIGIMLAIVGLTGLALNSLSSSHDQRRANIFRHFSGHADFSDTGNRAAAGPTYIITAIMCAPAMLQIGMPLLIVHMILIWYSIDSMCRLPLQCALWQQPDCQGRPHENHVHSVEILQRAIHPSLSFYYRPLLLNGPWLDVIITIVSCTIGLIVSAAFLERYLHTRANLTNSPARPFLPTAALAPPSF